MLWSLFGWVTILEGNVLQDKNFIGYHLHKKKKERKRLIPNPEKKKAKQRISASIAYII